jgi:hypothetical protein
MGSNYKMSYNVDLVFCIDATASMDGLLDMVKQHALTFHQDLSDAMATKRKTINQLRIRIVAFRDYKYDGEEAMLTTDFFLMPQEQDLFEQCIREIEAKGGGDDPEDGLEAMAYAIRSRWCEGGAGIKRRQVIVVWTDAATHELGFGWDEETYPREYMVRDFNELTSWWGDLNQEGFMDQNAKRLLLYAPDEPYWNTITANWDNVLHFPSEAGQGLDGVSYSEIIDTISNSI